MTPGAAKPAVHKKQIIYADESRWCCVTQSYAYEPPKLHQTGISVLMNTKTSYTPEMWLLQSKDMHIKSVLDSQSPVWSLLAALDFFQIQIWSKLRGFLLARPLFDFYLSNTNYVIKSSRVETSKHLSKPCGGRGRSFSDELDNMKLHNHSEATLHTHRSCYYIYNREESMNMPASALAVLGVENPQRETIGVQQFL